ncbi:MAG: hypothetical protein KAJ73_05440 [Zetaproteobacteria bacterium]|nr:hypothetical protein [Zetaproteobacteria bacterium]
MPLNKVTSKAVEADAKYMIDVDSVDGLHAADVMLDGELVLKAQSELTISSGVITVVGPGYYPVDTESDASFDELLTISGGTAGDIITLYPANSARTVLLMHTDGNIELSGEVDIPLAVAGSLVTLRYDGTDWRQMAGPKPVVFGYSLGNGVSVVASGTYGDHPYLPAMYILGIYGMANASGSISVDIRKETFGTIPDSADSIGTSPCFVMSSQQTKSDLVLSGITREQSAGCWQFVTTVEATTITQVAVVILGVLL